MISLLFLLGELYGVEKTQKIEVNCPYNSLADFGKPLNDTGCNKLSNKTWHPFNVYRIIYVHSSSWTEYLIHKWIKKEYVEWVSLYPRTPILQHLYSHFIDIISFSFVFWIYHMTFYVWITMLYIYDFSSQKKILQWIIINLFLYHPSFSFKWKD